MASSKVKRITSRDNTLVSLIVDLHDAKGRKKHGFFIAEGLRACSTLIQAGVELVHMLVTHECIADVQELIDEHEVIQVLPSVMNKISTSMHPSGIVGVFKIPASPSWSALKSGLVLARIADPGNMGTMIRTAVACGIKVVVIIEGADPFSPKAVQASAGTIGMITIMQGSWEELLKHKTALVLSALTIQGGQSPAVIVPQKTLLVVGSEAHGIPISWQEQCDQRITLPMPGGTESLNAAIAASIALYWGWIKQ